MRQREDFSVWRGVASKPPMLKKPPFFQYFQAQTFTKYNNMINLSSSLGEMMEWQNTRILAQKVRVFPYFQASKPIEYLELSSSLGEMVGFCSLNNTLVYRRK